ncbi:hypothetical protein DN051_01650 [Streptomyces cadmiisoli]|uniref:Uncharacterized protein n=1 Tax=Streptomyces cadmiisoli TaxID=2184053 RepID=A0A2Z4ITE7_9ACTN|nr:hypothetical protein DN051_01650 [Streptomyces cadmiisoli]
MTAARQVIAREIIERRGTPCSASPGQRQGPPRPAHRQPLFRYIVGVDAHLLPVPMMYILNGAQAPPNTRPWTGSSAQSRNDLTAPAARRSPLREAVDTPTGPGRLIPEDQTLRTAVQRGANRVETPSL